MQVTRYWVLINVSFCKMPPIEQQQLFYSCSLAPEEDFKNHLILDEGYELIKFQLTCPTKSPLTELPY